MKGLRTDKTTSLALDQLEHGGVIQLRRFKREPRMHIRDGLLYKGQRFVVHFMLRNEILALIIMSPTLVLRISSAGLEHISSGWACHAMQGVFDVLPYLQEK